MPAAPRTLTRDEARRVYDRIGARQDTQAFCENAALEILLRHGAFGEATRVFELGCGTGRVAELLLDGCGRGSRLTVRVWTAVHRWRPALVGGCRPLDLLPRLHAAAWSVRHVARLAPFGIPSEAVVAVRR